MEYKSQAGQDKFVISFFKEKKKGFFLDIGAHDGISFNNTFCLEKYFNWFGVCVEPNTKLFFNLQKNRGCLCINKAIFDENKEVSFYEDGYSGCIHEKGLLQIEAITMQQLLKECYAPKIIDYISLDIEGGEFKALSTFPFETYQVNLWTIEHNSYADKGKAKQLNKEIMLKNGYSIIKEDVINEGLPFEDWFINNNYHE